MCMHAKSLQSCLTHCDPVDYIAHQASLSMGFSRQEYWSVFTCPPSGDLPNPGVKPISLTSPALSGRFLTTRATWEAPTNQLYFLGKILEPCSGDVLLSL